MSAADLGGQVALVTGGGRGLGATLAQALAAAGASVAVTGRDPSTLAVTAARSRELGADVATLPADVTDPEAVEALLRRVAEELGPVDLLVNNAGITEDGPLWESDADEWWRVIEVNVRGPFLCSRAVLPEMIRRRRGRIVNVSSGVGNAPSVDQTAYAVSKAGVTRLTDSLAAQVGPYGIWVFAISPGLLRTDMGVALAERRGNIGEDDWVSPHLAAGLVVRIARGELDALTGRFMNVVTDDIDELVRRADEVRERDLQQLRLRPLG